MLKFINEQRYQECAVVSAINAAIYLGEPSIDPYSHEYERLVSLAGCRYGSYISMEEAYKYLRLKVTEYDFNLTTIQEKLNKKIPVSITVFTKQTGLHTVTIVDFSGGKYRVLNLNIPDVDKYRWIGESNLIKICEQSYPIQGYELIFPENEFRFNYLSFGEYR